MKKEQLSDLELIDLILKDEEGRDKALRYLVHHEDYHTMVNEIVKMGGGNDYFGKLIYENCIIQLEKQIRRKQYNATSLNQFFDKEARTSWCRELIVNAKARDHVLTHLINDHELEAKIHAAVIKNSGSGDDAKDIHQNGLIQVDIHLKEGKFRGGAIKGFFYQVCYNLWRNELKRKKNISLPEDGLDLSSGLDPQKELEKKEQAKLFDKIFGQLGESCQKILRLKFFVVDQYSMEEISMQMGFKNAQIASNTLSKCRKALWKLLQDHKPAFEWNRNI